MPERGLALRTPTRCGFPDAGLTGPGSAARDDVSRHRAARVGRFFVSSRSGGRRRSRVGRTAPPSGGRAMGRRRQTARWPACQAQILPARFPSLGASYSRRRGEARWHGPLRPESDPHTMPTRTDPCRSSFRATDPGRLDRATGAGDGRWNALPARGSKEVGRKNRSVRCATGHPNRPDHPPPGESNRPGALSGYWSSIGRIVANRAARAVSRSPSRLPERFVLPGPVTGARFVGAFDAPRSRSFVT